MSNSKSINIEDFMDAIAWENSDYMSQPKSGIVLAEVPKNKLIVAENQQNWELNDFFYYSSQNVSRKEILESDTYNFFDWINETGNYLFTQNIMYIKSITIAIIHNNQHIKLDDHFEIEIGDEYLKPKTKLPIKNNIEYELQPKIVAPKGEYPRIRLQTKKLKKYIEDNDCQEIQINWRFKFLKYYPEIHVTYEELRDKYLRYAEVSNKDCKNIADYLIYLDHYTNKLYKELISMSLEKTPEPMQGFYRIETQSIPTMFPYIKKLKQLYEIKVDKIQSELYVSIPHTLYKKSVFYLFDFLKEIRLEGEFDLHDDKFLKTSYLLITRDDIHISLKIPLYEIVSGYVLSNAIRTKEKHEHLNYRPMGFSWEKMDIKLQINNCTKDLNARLCLTFYGEQRKALPENDETYVELNQNYTIFEIPLQQQKRSDYKEYNEETYSEKIK